MDEVYFMIKMLLSYIMFYYKMLMHLFSSPNQHWYLLVPIKNDSFRRAKNVGKYTNEYPAIKSFNLNHFAP
jgi:hypothetical protein